MATEWGTRVEPPGEIVPTATSQDAYRAVAKATNTEGVTVAEMVAREDGGEWGMRARYFPGDFDAEGNYIHKGP